MLIPLLVCSLQHIRFAVQTLICFVKAWAGTVAGFNNFVYEKIIPTCFAIPTLSQFDIEDYTCGTVILCDIVTLMKTALDKLKGEFAAYMIGTRLPQLGLNQEQSQVFIVQLQNAAEKDFNKNMFRELFNKKKSQ